MTIECPNCGGRVERGSNEYFGRCPFCGTEVCFDEIKEEAQAGQISDLKDRVEAFEEKERFDAEGRSKIKKWRRWRNITYTAVFLLTFFSFFLVGSSTSQDPGNDALVGSGAVLFIMLFTVFFSGPPALATYYPDYDLISGKVRFQDRLLMWGRIICTCFGIAILSAFAAYVVLSAMGKA